MVSSSNMKSDIVLHGQRLLKEKIWTCAIKGTKLESRTHLGAFKSFCQRWQLLIINLLCPLFLSFPLQV